MRRTFTVAAVIISSYSQAQDSTKVLSDVIITANKVEQKQHETGKVISVISRKELEASGNKTLGEILNKTVGVTIGGANNPAGTNQSVYIRGNNYANTLILVDGIPLYDASGISSEFDLNSFTAEHIERVEILKGAQSTLYGSDAVAGVINIISRKPGKEKIAFTGGLHYGSYNTIKGSAGISGTIKGLDYFAGYTRMNSDGFSSAKDTTKSRGFDKDGFKQDAILARVGFSPVRKLDLTLFGRYNKNRGDIDAGAFTDDRDYTIGTQSFMTGLNGKYRMKHVTLHLNYNYHSYKRNYNDDSLHIGGYSDDPYAFYTKFIDEHYEGTGHFAELFADIKLSSRFSLVAGTDYRTASTNQEYFSISNYGPYTAIPLHDDSANTNQYAVYTSLLYKSSTFNAGLGARYNDHSVYGSNLTTSLNPSILINDKLKVFGNLATAFRVPSLYMLYSEYGNSNLEPERSVNAETGVKYQSGKWTAGITGFIQDTRDVFVFYYDASTFQSRYINEDRQELKGIEAEASWNIHRNWTLGANYTHTSGKLYTKDVSGKDTSFNNLYRRPQNVWNAMVRFSKNRLESTLALRTVSSFTEPKYMAAPVWLKGYSLVDLHVSYKLDRRFLLLADLKNLLDEEYSDLEGFNTRGINFSAGVSITL